MQKYWHETVCAHLSAHFWIFLRHSTAGLTAFIVTLHYLFCFSFIFNSVLFLSFPSPHAFFFFCFSFPVPSSFPFSFSHPSFFSLFIFSFSLYLFPLFSFSFRLFLFFHSFFLPLPPFLLFPPLSFSRRFPCFLFFSLISPHPGEICSPWVQQNNRSTPIQFSFFSLLGVVYFVGQMIGCWLVNSFWSRMLFFGLLTGKLNFRTLERQKGDRKRWRRIWSYVGNHAGTHACKTFCDTPL